MSGGCIPDPAPSSALRSPPADPRRRRAVGGGCPRCCRCPAEQLQQRSDQLMLGRSLVDRVKAGRIVEQGERLHTEGFELRGLRQGFLPGVGGVDAFFEKTGGKKLAGHWRWQMWRGSRRLPRLGDGLTGDTLRWADLSNGYMIRACKGYRFCRNSTIWRNAGASQSHTPASAASPSRRPGS